MHYIDMQQRNGYPFACPPFNSSMQDNTVLKLFIYPHKQVFASRTVTIPTLQIKNIKIVHRLQSKREHQHNKMVSKGSYEENGRIRTSEK